jgi:hypothetical protein
MSKRRSAKGKQLSRKWMPFGATHAERLAPAVLVPALGNPMVSAVRSRALDVIVTPVEDESAWWLTDRSGRPLVSVLKESVFLPGVAL